MKKTHSTEVVELNIFQIVRQLLRKCWVIILSTAICGGAVYYISDNWITPRYESSVLFYANNASFASDDRLSASDLYASEKLMDTYMVIMNSGSTISKILEYSQVELSQDEVMDMLTVRAVPKTVLFQVKVNGTHPDQVGRIAQAIGQVLPEQINTVLGGSYISIAEEGRMPTSPVTPKVRRNTISAVLFGFVFGASLIVLKMMGDTTIRSEKDIPKDWNLHVLTTVPESANGGLRKDKRTIRGKENPFALTPTQEEAYKFLRTNLMAAFPEEGCHVIGITSAMAGEGKSTTAVNLSRALAMDGQRVLLMDCDLRRPTAHKRLYLLGRPGITEILAGQFVFQELLKTVKVEADSFQVLTAGMLPPNPAELLSSQRMKMLIQQLRQDYQWIILDLPPLGEVSDALAVSPNVDEYLLVARRNRCERGNLKAVMQELAAVNSRILGVILNCTKK